MQTYKEWHDYVKDENGNNNPVFNKEAKIYFSQCSADNKMNLYELLKLTSDAATEDFNQRGLPWKVLMENHFIILVSRSSFHFHRRPRGDEHIVLQTWEETPQPLQFVRGYKISNDEGKVLVTGVSTWILVNPETRRIQRIADFKLRTPPVYSVPYEGIPAGKIMLPENMQNLEKRTINFCDIDSNGHTNNSRYGAFILDCLPEEYQNKSFSDFRINYSKEAVKGDTLQMLGAFDTAAKKITVAGKNGSTVCFESELIYR